MGFCALDNLTGFKLDPPRRKAIRCAICLFVKRDDEGFRVHDLQYTEPDQVDKAVPHVQKLRKLCKTSGQQAQAVTLSVGLLD